MEKVIENLADYTLGRLTMAGANAQMSDGPHMTPKLHTIFPDERHMTVVGEYPHQANGWGLMLRERTLMKVRVDHGRLVVPGAYDGCVVVICGRTYHVDQNNILIH